MTSTGNSSLLSLIRDNNSEETTKKAIKLLLQVVANIVKNPSEEKYRKLKEDKISPKIDNAKGFFDIITKIGFVTLPTHIELPMTASLEPLAALVGEIEGKPAPSVSLPKMDSKKNGGGGGCCSTDSGAETENCCSSKSDKKKSEACCGGNKNDKKKYLSGKGSSTDSHSHSHSHSHSDGHSHGHGHSHSDGHGDDGSCCEDDKATNAQKILHQNMAEIDKQRAEKKAEKEKIKQKMASSRKEKNSETTSSSVAKSTKFGATIGTLPKDTKGCGNGNGSGSGGCC